MMLKRQESFLSSSSRQDTPSAPPSRNQHARSIGCMAGIFRLLSKYHRRRKFLTSGRNDKKNIVSSPIETMPSSPERRAAEEEKSVDFRSPTIGAEIRKAAEAKARVSEPESEGEKRRKLMAALKKCNDDLEDLKKIIEERLITAGRTVTPPANFAGREEEKGGDKIQKIWKGNGNELKEEKNSGMNNNQKIIGQSHFTSGRKEFLLDLVDGKTLNCNKKPVKPRRNKQGEGQYIISSHFKNVITNSLKNLKYYSYYNLYCEAAAMMSLERSKAMVETVDEVCKDVELGEEKEVGSIGLELQDCICRELIEELAGEMSFGSSFLCSLPLESCKRSLRF